MHCYDHTSNFRKSVKKILSKVNVDVSEDNAAEKLEEDKIQPTLKN
jgi:hypothetical protein